MVFRNEVDNKLTQVNSDLLFLSYKLQINSGPLVTSTFSLITQKLFQCGCVYGCVLTFQVCIEDWNVVGCIWKLKRP